MSWRIEVRRDCSLDQIGRPKPRLALLKQDIVSGKKTCPVKGEVIEVVVDHPADNIVDQAAASRCDSCPLCGLEPKPEDFRKI
jgi:hypothetical protein